jgi:hypothetical protein
MKGWGWVDGRFLGCGGCPSPPSSLAVARAGVEGTAGAVVATGSLVHPALRLARASGVDAVLGLGSPALSVLPAGDCKLAVGEEAADLVLPDRCFPLA